MASFLVSASFSCSSVTYNPSPLICSRSVVCASLRVASVCHIAPFALFPRRGGKVPSASPLLHVAKNHNPFKLIRRITSQAVSLNLQNIATEEIYEIPFFDEDDSQEVLNGDSSDQTRFSVESVDLESGEKSSPAALKLDDRDPDRSRSQFDSFKIWFSDVVARKKKPYLFRDWIFEDVKTATGMLSCHILCLFAPFTFSWNVLPVTCVLLVITGIGLTLSYHRNLSHRSFEMPKWLEYSFAYCGVHAFQGDPSFWVSAHRYHHKHTEGEKDPHSPTQGIWHSHMGWFVDRKLLTDKVAILENIPDMINDPFYNFIRKTYALHPIMLSLLLYKLGGFPYVVWCMGVRGVWMYHNTSFVASVCHIWGERKFKTNDFSRNNWWVSLMCFGEGWHNNHHAFPSSAQQGFEWWEIDPTWGVISFLEKVGLATQVKRPTREAMAKLAVN